MNWILFTSRYHRAMHTFQLRWVHRTHDNHTYAPVFSAAQTITYDGNGNVQTVTENGFTTTYTYNPDGTVDTDTRAGVTRKYTYTNGNLTKIEVQ